MGELTRLPTRYRTRKTGAAKPRRLQRKRGSRYFAFLSYSHRDKDLAEWLHKELEKFRVPRALVGRLTDNGAIPRRLTPVFRDEQELAAAADLGEEIEAALEASRFLIVLCSPNAAKSRWANAEVEFFKKARPDDNILAAIASGEPFASDIAGREDEECFPPALRYQYDRHGRATPKRAEPLAADLRGGDEVRRIGLLKLIAGMIGVGLDELVQRETRQRNRRLAWLAAASLAGMAITSGLAFTAIQARDAARDQRREAEGLVAYMVGDLKDKLEPIGKLDALDGVASRVLAYYQKQDTADLSDAALLQRSRALSITAQVAYARGNQLSALKLYQEAQAGTKEAVRRNPDDPQRLYDHAQNVFWIGEISRFRGQLGAAEAAYSSYKKLAGRMVALQPDNLRWKMEAQYAEANLGIVYYQQRRLPEADRAFGQALAMIEPLASIDPNNGTYQKSLAEGLGWLADTERAEGRIDEAIALRRRQIDLLTRLEGSTDDVDYAMRAIPAHQALAMLFEFRGQPAAAETELRMAIAKAARLISVDAQNAVAKTLAAGAHLELGKVLLASDAGDAVGEANIGCALASQLMAKGQTMFRWRQAQSECFALRARLALAGKVSENPIELAERAVTAGRNLNSGDAISDSYLLASYQRLLGDAQARAGNRAAATSAWQSGLAGLPNNSAERPWELNERFQLLRRVGRARDALPLATKLAALHYRGIE
jgi:tetratricopeptide (TPR) repeat protein